MKIKENNKTVTPSIDTVVRPAYKAQIDKSAANMVMEILAKLYDNPLAAAIREYTSNAIDAHVAAGVTKAVEVSLPSKQNPWLIVRDYGKGLTAFDILTTYANFGSSDKRNSDALIGGFGIGSKSGLAISDAVYINSWTGGKLNSFVLKRASEGIVTQFLKEDVDAPGVATGTEIKVFVNTYYINTACESDWKRDMYKPLAGWSLAQVKVQHDNPEIAHFINEHRIPDSWHEFKHGFTNNYMIDDNNACIDHGAIIGGVYYDFNPDLDRIYQNIPAFAYKNGSMDQSFVLKLNIADVRVNYSREKILWRESKETLNTLANAIKGLVNDIKLAVDSIKACNLDPETYSQRLLALQLNIKNLSCPSEYATLLLKTPALDLSKPLKLDNVRMTFLHNLRGKINSRNVLRNNIDLTTSGSKYYITVDDTVQLDNKMNNVRRVIQKIYSLDESAISQQPDLKSINEWLRWADITIVIVMHQSDFDKIPSIYCPYHDTFKSLQTATTAAIKQTNFSNGNNSTVIPRSQRVYMMTRFYPNDPTLEYLKPNASYEEQRRTLFLPHDSKYAFMAKKNISRAPQTILATLPFDTIVCAKTQIDFKRMRTAQPNAIVMSDDEISAAIAKHLHERAWAANDLFCRGLFNELNSYTYAEDDDKHKRGDNVRPICQMGIPYQDTWRDIHYVTYEMNRIDNYKNSEPAYADIQKLMQAMPINTHAHQVTADLRLLLTISRSQYTYLYRQELDDLINKVKSQYTYEIDLIQKLYC